LLNFAGAYLLGLKLGCSRATAGLLGMSSIAFTPLHWATGVIELLTGTLLLGATLLHLQGGRRSLWPAALVALTAMLSKETAASWPLVVALIAWRTRTVRSAMRATLPAAAITDATLLSHALPALRDAELLPGTQCCS
jgi:hypothetical protein